MMARSHLSLILGLALAATPLLLLPAFSGAFSEYGDLYLYGVLALAMLAVGFVLFRKKVYRILYPAILPSLLMVVAAGTLASIFSIERRFSLTGFSMELGTLISILLMVGLVWSVTLVFGDPARASKLLFGYVASITLVVGAYLFLIWFRALFAGQETVIAHVPSLALIAGTGFILTLALREYFFFSSGVRGLLVAVVVVLGIFLVALPTTAVWLAVGAVLLLMALWRLQLDGRPAALMTLAAVAFLLYFLAPILPLPHTQAPLTPTEPSLSDSLATAQSLMFGQPLRIVVGNGLNTYADTWNRFKPASVNETQWWGLSYAHGVSLWDTLLLCGGLLMVVALAWPLLKGVRSFVRHLRTEEEIHPVYAVAGMSALFGWLATVLYAPTSAALSLPIVLSALAWTYAPGAHLRVWSPKRWPMLGALLLLTVGALLLGYVYLQARALTYYNRGLTAALVHRDGVESQAAIAQAIRTLPQPVYYRALSEIQQQQLLTLLKDVSISAETAESAFGAYANAAVFDAKKAVDMEPADMLNWIVLGDAYTQLAFARIEGALPKAQDAYIRASFLAPKNPLPLYLIAKLLQGVGDVAGARAYTKSALALKADYQEARVLAAELGL